MSEPTQYYTESQWRSLKTEADKHSTPNLVSDLSIIRNNYLELQNNYPYAKIYAAVKANPDKRILSCLAKLGSNFDCASIYELDEVLSLGVTPDRISFGNTIKKVEDIHYAYQKGVRLFVSDSQPDLKNIAENAPGADVFFRVIIDGSVSSEWPLSFKFGADDSIIEDLIPLSKILGLNPRGVSFHVGSQQNDISVWNSALTKVSKIFQNIKKNYGIELDLINMGGGLPSNYISKHASNSEYAEKIKSYLDSLFPEGYPSTIIMEPGRSLFASASILSTTVILISKKDYNTTDRWLYIDTGIYNGLIETLGESIHYPLYCEAKGELTNKFIIAGNTCDSIDVCYKNFRNPLPSHIKIGDKIYMLTTGAYTASCCSIGFNGFPPMAHYVIDSEKIEENN